MNMILRPATNLMNRLTYLKKFMLISLLFLLPLLSLTYVQLKNFHEVEQVTKKELSGLTELRNTLSLVKIATERSDLIFIRGGYAHIDASLAERTKQKESDYIQLLKTIETSALKNDQTSALPLIKNLINEIQIDRNKGTDRMSMGEKYEIIRVC